MLWIYDGHSTHVNPTIIDWARSNRIILFVLPAHHSHILQPLDVGCFGPLQRIYNVKAQHEQEKKNVKKSKPNEKGKGTKKKCKSKVSKVTTSETSEVRAIPGPSHVMVSCDESDHSDEQDVCCVCRKSSPPALREILYNRILFVKWAQCEKCGHWVHVKFCTDGADVRRTSSYICPCCTNQHVNLSHEQ